MILSGGHYGGYEVVGNTVVFEDTVVPCTQNADILNVEGWLYNEEGIFIGMENG